MEARLKKPVKSGPPKFRSSPAVQVSSSIVAGTADFETTNQRKFRIDFSHSLPAVKPRVLVSLAGFHIGTFDGVASVLVDVIASDSSGFDIEMRQGVPGPSVTHIYVSWIAFG
jgi:hypothetical protein